MSYPDDEYDDIDYVDDEVQDEIEAELEAEREHERSLIWDRL